MPEPTEEEIRRVLAEKVMGWRIESTSYGLWHYYDDSGKISFFNAGEWDPLRNIEQAVRCADKLSEMGIEYEEKYTDALEDIVKKSFNCRGKWSRLYFREIQATAEQRARACYDAIKEEKC